MIATSDRFDDLIFQVGCTSHTLMLTISRALNYKRKSIQKECHNDINPCPISVEDESYLLTVKQLISKVKKVASHFKVSGFAYNWIMAEQINDTNRVGDVKGLKTFSETRWAHILSVIDRFFSFFLLSERGFCI